MVFRPNVRAAALVLAAGTLAGCETMGTAAGGSQASAARAATETFVPVTTEEAFREEVVGREVVYANGAIGTYGADNTWTVTGGDGVLASGTWTWREDSWCYGGRVGGEPLAPRCDDVAVSETGVRFTQEDRTVGILRFRG